MKDLHELISKCDHVSAALSNTPDKGALWELNPWRQNVR